MRSLQLALDFGLGRFLWNVDLLNLTIAQGKQQQTCQEFLASLRQIKLAHFRRFLAASDQAFQQLQRNMLRSVDNDSRFDTFFQRAALMATGFSYALHIQEMQDGIVPRSDKSVGLMTYYHIHYLGFTPGTNLHLIHATDKHFYQSLFDSHRASAVSDYKNLFPSVKSCNFTALQLSFNWKDSYSCYFWRSFARNLEQSPIEWTISGTDFCFHHGFERKQQVHQFVIDLAFIHCLMSAA
jgi:hypothetical protein